MKRAVASLFLFCTLSSSAYADTAPPNNPATNSPLNNSAALKSAAQTSLSSAIVARAERERRAGRIPEAAEAYAQALKIELDPVIGGRLGVLLVELEQPTKAADLLLLAIENATDAPPAERHGFLTAFDKALTQVCRVDIEISEAHTTLSIDGVDKFPDTVTGFTLFLKPGEHELRARLPKFADGVHHFTALKGARMRVPLVLTALDKPESVDVPEDLFRKRRQARREAKDVVRSLEDPPQDEPEKRVVYGGVDGGPKPEKTRIEVAAGPVIVFGVASWQPAIGAVAGVRWRPKDYFSLGAEGRAAWLSSGVGGGQINAMTAGGIASLCGHWRWLFGCALGHLGMIKINTKATSYEANSESFVKPGLGGRVGGSIRLSRGFVLGGSFDILRLDLGIRVISGQTVLVNQPPVMISGQLYGGWEF